jgi:prepilin-type N-terminal cleavage/methylation domain-containing protein
MATKVQTTDRTGFTLIELLTVIAIVTLLATIAGIAVCRALEQTRVTLCKNNLHCLGDGLWMYAGDNLSCLPVDPAIDNPHTVLINATQKYISSSKSYYCPSLNQGDSSFTNSNFLAGRIGYFYYSCDHATSNKDVSTFLRWNVTWPRKLTTTMDKDTWVLSDQWFSALPTSHWCYNKGVAYLVLDSSVRFVEDSPRQSFE